MSEPFYKTMVMLCAALWFLVGLHAPIIHHITGHGASVVSLPLAMTAAVTLAAISALVVLLRARLGAPRTGSGA